MKALFFSQAGRRQAGRTSGSLCHPTHPCCAASFSCTCSRPESDAASITSAAATLLDGSAAATLLDGSAAATLLDASAAATLLDASFASTTNPSLSTLDAAYTTPPVWPVQLDASMMKRGRAKRDGGPASLAACPLSLDSGSLATGGAATAVQIAGRPHRCKQPRRGGGLAPSLAALLAGTDIPPRVRRRPCSSPGDDRGRGTQSRPCKAALGEPLIADEYGEAAGPERPDEAAVAVVHSPGLLDVLLSCPEEEDDESTSGQADGGDSSSSDSHGDSGSMLARTTSADSIPSLGGSSLATEPASVPNGLVFAQRRRTSPARRLLEPVRSPPHAAVEHPLAAVPASDLDDVPQAHGAHAPTTPHDADNDADDEQESKKPSSPPLLENFKPLRSVFKSNLSASLRALRSAAARSLSGFNPPPLPPDDLLTRSILTIDAKVPYADERRPPVCEEVPSAELRRYLNPPTSNRIDFPQPKPGTRRFSASIQMQTYKVQRSRSALSALAAARGHSTPPPPPPPPSSSPPPAQAASLNPSLPLRAGGMRQREVRENPDFIRIAVMEMAMRRVGKLDAQRPGRARWALPPRRPASKAYEIGANGVPLRWTPMTC